jgi:hypothetical protein
MDSQHTIESLERWLTTNPTANGPRGDQIRRIVSQLRDGQDRLSDTDREVIRRAMRNLAADAAEAA